MKTIFKITVLAIFLPIFVSFFKMTINEALAVIICLLGFILHELFDINSKDKP